MRAALVILLERIMIRGRRRARLVKVSRGTKRDLTLERIIHNALESERPRS